MRKLTRTEQTAMIASGLGVLVLVGTWLLVSSRPQETQVRGNAQNETQKIGEIEGSQNIVVELMRSGEVDESVDTNKDGIIDISDL